MAVDGEHAPNAARRMMRSGVGGGNQLLGLLRFERRKYFASLLHRPKDEGQPCNTIGLPA